MSLLCVDLLRLLVNAVHTSAGGGQVSIRVLIANRGEHASRLIQTYRAMGFETVSLFAKSEADSAFVEEADYATYLSGEGITETYLDVARVVAAATDAGCDAIHPGYCFLPERAELSMAAGASNIVVVGPEAKLQSRVGDRFSLYATARTVGVPLIPTSKAPILEDDDARAPAALLGFPLMVKALHGGAMQRVSRLEELSAAVKNVRVRALRQTGISDVYLQRELTGDFRRCGVTVVADRHGHMVHLGVSDASIGMHGQTWIEELGDVVDARLYTRLVTQSIKLAKALQWWGVGTVRWAVQPNGGAYLLSLSARLTTGLELAEVAHGVDLVKTQWQMLVGEELVWEQSDVVEKQHVVQLRVLHMNGVGQVSRLRLPTNVAVACSVQEGAVLNEHTDPLLLKITVRGSTRTDALSRARAVMDDVVLEGVQTNIQGVRDLLGSKPLVLGTHTVYSASEQCDARASID